MALYRFDHDLHIVEHCPCDLKAALETFEHCYLNGCALYDSGEDAYVATCFGLSKSSTDFIELACNGQDSVTVYSDRLFYPTRLSRLFASKQHFFIKGGKAAAIEIIRNYFSLDREAFESKYAEFLCR